MFWAQPMNKHVQHNCNNILKNLIVASTYEQTHPTQLQQYSFNFNYDLNLWANMYNTIPTIFPTSNCDFIHLDIKTMLILQPKHWKHQMPFSNTLDIFYLSFLVLHAMQWPPPFCNGFFVLVLPKTIMYNVSLFFQQSPQNWLNPKHWRWQILI